MLLCIFKQYASLVTIKLTKYLKFYFTLYKKKQIKFYKQIKNLSSLHEYLAILIIILHKKKKTNIATLITTNKVYREKLLFLAEFKFEYD